jgi:hypothetical protein
VEDVLSSYFLFPAVVVVDLCRLITTLPVLQFLPFFVMSLNWRGNWRQEFVCRHQDIDLM